MVLKRGDVYAVGIDKYLVVYDLGKVLNVLHIMRDTKNKANVLEINTMQGQILKVNPHMITPVKRTLLVNGDKIAQVDEKNLESIRTAI